MKITVVIFILICFFSCKNEKQDIPVLEQSDEHLKLKDSTTYIKTINYKDKIDFNKSPIQVKSATLNDKEFWVTSSMIDSKYLDERFCEFKDYSLQREYNIINKEDDIMKNILAVYVKDDSNKWNREKATEEFKEIKVKDSSIKLWDRIYVGMKVDSLSKLIQNVDYHRDNGIFRLYSKVFEGSFYFSNDEVDSLEVSRKCFSKKEGKRQYHITIHDFEKDEDKDTIVNFDFLENDEMLFPSFNYKPFENRIKSDTLSMLTTNMEVVIVKSKFDKSNSTITYDKDSLNVMTIDGHDLVGADNIPLEYISGLYLNMSGNIAKIDKKYYQDLYEPDFKSSKAYYYDNEIIIEMNNSDGYLGYSVYLFIDRLKNIKRIIYIP